MFVFTTDQTTVIESSSLERVAADCLSPCHTLVATHRRAIFC